MQELLLIQCDYSQPEIIKHLFKYYPGSEYVMSIL